MIPVRTCVGCGVRAPQAGLVRVVTAPSGLVVDRRRRLGGRGAWLHPAPPCWDAFVKRRGPVRSLRATPPRAERERLVAALRATIGVA